MFNHPTPELVGKLAAIVGRANTLTAPDQLEDYSHDETPHFHALPDIVVKPASAGEVAAILKLASRHAIPVTARGGGTSLSAGAVPACGGIVLSLARMNRILEIDEENLMAVVEPGVITGELEKELDRRGLFFPPDPVSMDSCTIGGNIAECAGGPRAMKYGVTKNYVTGLKAVIADGTPIALGGKLIKNVTGYDLIDLLVGSEGTLAIVTEATLRLLPRPAAAVDMLVPFGRLDAACRYAREIIRGGPAPAIIEYMNAATVGAVCLFLNRPNPCAAAGAYLIIRLDGEDLNVLRQNYDRIGELGLKAGAIDVLVAESAKDREKIWEIRKKTGDALKALWQIVAREDLVVPKSAIPPLVEKLTACAAACGATFFAFGHLGDGNIHADFGMARGTALGDRERAGLRREIYEITVGLGGAITAEHGVGLAKREYLPLALEPAAIEIMRAIKNILDPEGILNPGKIFPQ